MEIQVPTIFADDFAEQIQGLFNNEGSRVEERVEKSVNTYFTIHTENEMEQGFINAIRNDLTK